MSGTASDCDPALAQPARLNVSIIIPTLNAAATLGATLNAAPPVDDVIVVDGGSLDGTVDSARGKGARVLFADVGRGTQMSAGARAATHDWMLFLHADTRLGPEAHSAIAAFTAGSDNKLRAATFRFALDDDCWQARTLQRVVQWRTDVLGLPYGDQGLLIHRDLYQSVGGFSHVPLMEDVDIVRRIGRQRLVSLSATAITSARKWKTQGWLARSTRNGVCLSLYYLGFSPRFIARLYG